MNVSTQVLRQGYVAEKGHRVGLGRNSQCVEWQMYLEPGSISTCSPRAELWTGTYLTLDDFSNRKVRPLRMTTSAESTLTCEPATSTL